MLFGIFYIFTGIIIGIMLHQYLETTDWWEPNTRIFYGHIDEFKDWVYKKYGTIYHEYVHSNGGTTTS